MSAAAIDGSLLAAWESAMASALRALSSSAVIQADDGAETGAISGLRGGGGEIASAGS